MTTAIAKAIPTLTPEIAKSLSQQDLQEHRQKIASEVRVVLSAYFQPSETEQVKAAQLSWWCDELQDWTVEQIVWALRKWNSENPDRRPTPGHIVSICKRERGRKYAASVERTPEPERDRITPEAATEILKRAGFRVNKFGGME